MKKAHRYIEATETGRNHTASPVSGSLKKIISIETVFVLALLFMAFLGLYHLVSLGQTANSPKDADKELSIVFFDVYQGDAILINTPSGKHILIDGGQGANKYARFDGGAHVVVPYLKKHNINRLDQVIMTHPHADHVGGLLTVLNEITVGEVLDPGMTYGSELYKRFLLKIERRKITWTEAHDGMVLDWGDEIHAQVLSPKLIYRGTRSDANNNSIVIKMIYKSTSFLFTGDIEVEAERDLLDYGKQLRANVLKVPHHGGEFSSTISFVEMVKPEFVVIMCGKNNKFGHPHKNTLERYRDMGSTILRTDLCGDVLMISDGRQITVSTEKTCQ